MDRANLWIRTENAGLLTTSQKYTDRLPLQTSKNFPGLLAGYVADGNEVTARTKHPELLVGKVRPWDAVRDVRCLYVILPKNELSTGPVIMSQYAWTNVIYHSRKKLISQKRDVERVEMLPGENFVTRAFDTFDYFFSQRAKTGFKPRLVLYDPDGQLDIEGNITNPTPPEQLLEAIAKKREQGALIL